MTAIHKTRSKKRGRHNRVAPLGDPVNNKEKTMLLDITFAAMETVRLDQRPGSRRENSMVRSQGRVGGLMSHYRPAPWPKIEIDKADVLIDEFNAMIVSEFGSKSHDELMLHLGLATFELVRYRESGAARKRLDTGLDTILGVIGVYDIERLPPRVVSRAGALADRFESRIAEVFGYGGNNHQNMPTVQ